MSLKLTCGAGVSESKCFSWRILGSCHKYEAHILWQPSFGANFKSKSFLTVSKPKDWIQSCNHLVFSGRINESLEKVDSEVNVESKQHLRSLSVLFIYVQWAISGFLGIFNCLKSSFFTVIIIRWISDFADCWLWFWIDRQPCRLGPA